MNTLPEVSPVTAQLVSDSERGDFIPQMFVGRLHYEQSVYGFLDQICKQYQGAWWHFYRLSNGGFYMAPDVNESLELNIEMNGYSGTVSADAAGIIVSLYILCFASAEMRVDSISDHFHWLREFALDHAESRAIFMAID